jgi:hypothetical protein
MRVYSVTFIDAFGEDSMYFNAASLEQCISGFAKTYPEYTLVSACLATEKVL